AAVLAGAPEGIIGWIDEPSLELTTTVMKEVDLTLATGGPGMVKSAYSSGKPAKTAASRTTFAASIVEFFALGCGEKIIPFLVF
ncbi:hypothetical protein, partial [Clostridioides difficile]|uniref:hypothetical protein n=1 Tax=Clostridioides difficile TaxID=1496 RepID=UPI0018DBC85A